MLLKPGGFASNVIDYGAHEFSEIWYEHLYLNEKFWKFLMHGRMYPINRFPHSFHIQLLEEIGFDIIYEEKVFGSMPVRQKLDSKLRDLFKDEDLCIKSAYIIVKKQINY